MPAVLPPANPRSLNHFHFEENPMAAAAQVAASRVNGALSWTTSEEGKATSSHNALKTGLWDMHVHLRSPRDRPLPQLVSENESVLDLVLPNGIVGIREMGGDLADQVIQ